MGLRAFRTAYGTNHNKTNAFGKCVSTMAKPKTDALRVSAVARIAAADRCRERITKDKGKGKAKQLAKVPGAGGLSRPPTQREKGPAGPFWYGEGGI